MIKKQEEKFLVTQRLVKSEDLNHHGTLFAGRSAEWFIESGFIAATKHVDPQNIVCLKLHGMRFSKPARIGDVICFDSKVVYAGKTSLITYTKVYKRGNEKEAMVEGFTTFVSVTHQTKPKAHGVVVVPRTAEEKRLYNEAKALKK